MPLYTYECTSCKKIVEQNRSVDNRDRCVLCNCNGLASGSFKRIIDLSHVHFKGSGWAKDGYAKKK